MRGGGCRRVTTFLCVVFLDASLPQVLCVSPTVSLGTLSVAPVALGTLNLSPENAAETIKAAPTNVLIDTAEIYASGKAELMVQSACRQAGRVLGETAYCATKFAPRSFGSAKSVVTACRESASRLGVESIDLYQIHYADSLVQLVSMGLCKPQDEAYWDGLASCYHQGLAANVGVCNYGPTMVRRAYEALQKRGVPLVSNQIGFNLMRYGITSETKTVCDELGIKVLAYSPIGKGVISGKYDIENLHLQIPEKEGTMGRHYRVKRCLKETTALRNVLQRISDSTKKTWPQIAYNWSICKGTIPIAGCLDATQAADMAGATGWQLSDDEIAELDLVAGENISPSREFVLR